MLLNVDQEYQNKQYYHHQTLFLDVEDQHNQEVYDEIMQVYFHLNVVMHLVQQLMVYQLMYDNYNHQDKKQNHILIMSHV